MPARIHNIQALRGFAALLVVFGHAGLMLPGLHPFGTFGVDVFFVISGFIMAMICDRNPERFFLRRLIRIVPLYWAATLGVFALAYFAPALMKTTRASFHDLALSLLFVPFYKLGATSANPVLFVGWTLNYEMYFYVILALCLAACGTMKIARSRAPWLASAALAVLMMCCKPFAGRWAFARMYAEPLVLEFVMGIAVYWLVKTGGQERATKLRGAAWLLMLGGAALLILMEGREIVWAAIGGWQRPVLWGLPAMLLVLGGALLTRGGEDTSSKTLVLLGDASYVIYIIHIYVLDGFERVLARRLPALEISRPLGCAISLSLTALLSVGMYLYAERPTVNWLSTQFGTRRIRKPETPEPAESMA